MCAGMRKFRTIVIEAWVEEVESTGNGGSSAAVDKEQLCLRLKRGTGRSRSDGVVAKAGTKYGKPPAPSPP